MREAGPIKWPASPSRQGENDMATTIKEPRPNLDQTRADGGGSKTSTHTTAHELSGQAKSMKAIVQDQYGSADVLQLRDINRPEVGLDDVLIRVHAAGVHIGDWHLMTGEPYLMRIIGFGFRGPKARVRGMDVAGTVEAVGQNVTRFHAGDEVFGTCDGAFAEYASARADMLAPKPA